MIENGYGKQHKKKKCRGKGYGRVVVGVGVRVVVTEGRCKKRRRYPYYR